jgi:hypothetical protein
MNGQKPFTNSYEGKEKCGKQKFFHQTKLSGIKMMYFFYPIVSQALAHPSNVNFFSMKIVKMSIFLV